MFGTDLLEDAGEGAEYDGTSNGAKVDELNEMGDTGKDKDDAAEKPPATDADTEAKELQPDFTVTPSKESQSAARADTYLNLLEP